MGLAKSHRLREQEALLPKVIGDCFCRKSEPRASQDACPTGDQAEVPRREVAWDDGFTALPCSLFWADWQVQSSCVLLQ